MPFDRQRFRHSRACLTGPAWALLRGGLELEMMSTETSAESDGFRTLKSPDSFAGTVGRLTSAFEGHGIKIFAIIDQQAEAAAVGLAMRPVTLILFGNPKAGTPLMVAKTTAALDLPLKVVVWEAEDGGVFVSFNTAGYVIARHHLPEALGGNLAPAEKMIAAALG
jgi:uncharacterized protein (DUF302 family)